MTNGRVKDGSPRKESSWLHENIFSYSCKVRGMICLCILLLATALAVIYFLLVKTTSDPHSVLALPKKLNWFPQCPSSLLHPLERFDCYPDDKAVDCASCEARGCCYLGLLAYDDLNHTVVDDRVPTCVYPVNYGYEASGKAEVTLDGFQVPLRRIAAPSRYGDDIQNAYVRVEMQTKYRLRIKFYDAENSRYEVPVPKMLSHHSTREILLYSLTYNTFSSPFAIKVRRSSTESVLFDTSPGAFTFSNQFLELTTRLPSGRVFGLGQYINKHHHEFNWETIQLFASKTRDGKFSSSIHPFYLCVEEDGKAFGVLLLNSNAMEVQLHPSQAITFRSTGGILDFYIFMGPSPDEVIQQYTEAIGRPTIPPYWSLGLHFGLDTYQSVDEIENIVNTFQEKYIPMESVIVSQYVIQKYLSKEKEFKNFSSITLKLESKGQKLQVYFAPSISKDYLIKRAELYSIGKLADVFVTDKWGLHPVVGKYNEVDVFYPDFGSYPGSIWWSDVIHKIASTTGFDGFWLANNEPVNDVDGSTRGCLRDDLNNPPYLPGAPSLSLYEKTLCMDTLLHWRDDVLPFYDFHNLYGFSMTMATEQAFTRNNPKIRKLLLSDSTFISTGQYSGHLVKGLERNWRGLQSSIAAVLEQGIFGLAFSGATLCEPDLEDISSARDELCLRWLQLSVFFPLLLVYGSNAEHFFNAVASSREFSHAVRNAISRRYELLPHLYTLLYLAHTNGSTVIRSLYHEFPNDNETYSIRNQFMWGSFILVSPIIEKGAKGLDFYLPRGIWYDYYQGSALHSSGEWFQETGGPFHDTKQPAVLHIRAGSMIVLQKPADTTFLSRQNSMSLLVALDSSSEANGLLFWDDGDTKNSHILGEYILVDFVASGTSFVVMGNFGKKAVVSNFYRALIQQVRIMGLHKPPKRIIIDRSYILSNKQYYWNYDTKVLDLKHILIPLARQTRVEWVF